MARVMMYQQPLERYLLSKMPNGWSGKIQSIQIRRLRPSTDECNWDVASFEPPLPPEMIAQLEREVIGPVRATIDLAD